MGQPPQGACGVSASTIRAAMTDAAIAERTGELERVEACPLCGGERLEELAVANLNGRDPARRDRLAEHVGGDFFAGQRLSFCHGCGHVFQSTRPTPEALQRLYDVFATTVAKVTPTEDNMFEYFLKENSQDYVHGPAKALEFLDCLGVVERTRSALEIRTYGGALVAMLRERGVDHVEAGVLQEFDAQMGRRVFGLDGFKPFTFTQPIGDFRPARDEYDLIVSYEALTHSPDPSATLRWIRERLSDDGVAVLFREPDTPAYRRYQPLSVVFNNFHMHLLNRDTARKLVARAGGLSLEVHEERHPGYVTPLHLNLVLRRSPGGEPDADGPAELGLDYYRSWAGWETTPGRRMAWEAGRRLTHLSQPIAESLREEARGAVAALRARLGRA
jgi:hypothetical protein